jgi:hypothetical protein
MLLFTDLLFYEILHHYLEKQAGALIVWDVFFRIINSPAIKGRVGMDRLNTSITYYFYCDKNPVGSC